MSPHRVRVARRLRWTGGLLCLLVALLPACARPTPVAEAVTISFAFPEVDVGFYQALVQTFNQSYPDVTVELRPLSWDLMDSLSADEADVFAADAFTLEAFAEEGGLLPLDAFIEVDQSFDPTDFYPGALGQLASEGETWAIPAGVDVDVLYFSQDLFDQAGLSYPEAGWSWDDLLNSAIAISDPDAGIYGYTTTPGHFDAVLFVYQGGGRIVDSLQHPTRTTFDEPLTIEALEWYARLFREYDVAPTPAEAAKAFGGSRYASYQGIRYGKVGMWVRRLSERGGLIWPVEWTVNWGMAPLPSGEQPVTDAWVEGYAISSETDHPDACWRWIRFLSGQVTYRLVPPRRSLVASKEYERLVGKEVAAAARASIEQAVFFSPRVWTRFGEAMDLFDEAVSQIIDGDVTVEEAMVQAQREAETKLSP